MAEPVRAFGPPTATAPIEVVTDVTALRSRVAAWRRAGETVAFVPTMGALHEGHLSLARIGRAKADRVVASVFVNPTQFGPDEDLASYPRDAERDAALLATAGCDLLFLPPVEAVYPSGNATRIAVEGPPAEGLEATYRPGHFKGVATVVTILLNLVAPDIAIFGRKDAQQLAVVRRLVEDLALPVEIVAGPTVREPDGVAMSSRNAYLDAAERRAATVLSASLRRAEGAFLDGERDAGTLRAILRETLEAEPLARIDYAEVVDAATFRPVDRVQGPVVLPLAVRIGKARLLDNLSLDLPVAMEESH